MIGLNKSKIIDINEYKMKKLRNKTYKNTKEEKDTEEERKKTLNLFMRVLATMKKESYK